MIGLDADMAAQGLFGSQSVVVEDLDLEGDWLGDADQRRSGAWKSPELPRFVLALEPKPRRSDHQIGSRERLIAGMYEELNPRSLDHRNLPRGWGLPRFSSAGVGGRGVVDRE